MGSAHQESSAGHGIEKSERLSSNDDWDSMRYRCDHIFSDAEGRHIQGEGYMPLEEEQEEEEEEVKEGDGEDTDRLVGLLQIQGRRHTSTVRKMHLGYGSLARKTQ